jgi:hypothetical protein
VDRLEDTRVLSAFKEEEGGTVVGGTVHVFRGCIRSILDCTFCYNGGIPKIDGLAARGALYIESPTCALMLNSSYFEGNEVALDGAALQVCHQAMQRCLPYYSLPNHLVVFVDVDSQYICLCTRNSLEAFKRAVRSRCVCGLPVCF